MHNKIYQEEQKPLRRLLRIQTAFNGDFDLDFQKMSTPTGCVVIPLEESKTFSPELTNRRYFRRQNYLKPPASSSFVPLLSFTLMQTLSLAVLFLVLFLSLSFVSPSLTYHSITPSLYDALVLYTKYSSAAYQPSCKQPLGHVLVKRVSIIILLVL